MGGEGRPVQQGNGIAAAGLAHAKIAEQLQPLDGEKQLEQAVVQGGPGGQHAHQAQAQTQGVLPAGPVVQARPEHRQHGQGDGHRGVGLIDPHGQGQKEAGRKAAGPAALLRQPD